jgi:hypothetical protein
MTVNIIKNFIKKMKEKGMQEVKLMSEDDDYYYFQMANPLPCGGHSLVIMKEPKIAKGFDLEF